MDVWPQVDTLVDRAHTVSDLRHHRLHLYAAWRWRAEGRPIPHGLVGLERGAAAVRLARPAIAKVVRNAYDGPIVLLKGADVAALYPVAELRPSWDLDLLVLNAEVVQRTLLDYGFEERAPVTPPGHHHHQGLVWRNLPGRVEVHSAPNWPTWLVSPRAEEIIEAATTESSIGNGILALDPAHQTLLLTAHLWCDDPLRSLGNLIDVALMAQTVDPDALNVLARRWNVEALWSTTQEILEEFLTGGRARPPRSRFLTKSLESMRERSVIESKLMTAVAPFYVLAPAHAAARTANIVFSWLQPKSGETRRAKLSRTMTLLPKLLMPQSKLEQEQD